MCRTNLITRLCIKCGEYKPIGYFDDNWRHKVNVCKDCQSQYQRERYAMEKQRRDAERIKTILAKRS